MVKSLGELVGVQKGDSDQLIWLREAKPLK
jgi:hypothetical protein